MVSKRWFTHRYRLATPVMSNTPYRANTADRDHSVRRVILIEGTANLAVLLAKLVVGFATGSLAVLGDAVHSLTDLSNNVVVHNCFIISVEDDLVGEGGIMDLVTSEARLFKYGSGTGTNYSRLRGRGEPLSGGGISSGLLSFLKVGDRSASAIKSGGTTRRAARMVTLDADHPDVEQYVDMTISFSNSSSMSSFFS